MLVVTKAALVLTAFPVMFHQVSKLTGIQDISELIQPVVYAATPTVLGQAVHWGSAGLMLVAGTIITLVVWVVGHAADVLALLSPVPWVDLIVKASRVAVMLAVSGCAVMESDAGANCVTDRDRRVRAAVLAGFASPDPGSGSLGGMFCCGERTPLQTGVSARLRWGRFKDAEADAGRRLSRDPNGILEFRYRRLGLMRRVRLEDASAFALLSAAGFYIPPCCWGKRLSSRLLPRYRGSGGRGSGGAGVGLRSGFGVGEVSGEGGRAITRLPDELVVSAVRDVSRVKDSAPYLANNLPTAAIL